MADKLDSGAVSTFCESVSMMLAAGIQTEEAIHLVSENMEDSPFKRVCDCLYGFVSNGASLYSAMERTRAFPPYAINMVAAGEQSGRLENVLNSLAVYYSEEDRLFSKMRSAILYPAGLLLVMDLILLFTATSILPVFNNVYRNISGDMFAGSFVYVGIATRIGWVALAFIVVCTIAAIAAYIMASGSGRATLMRLMERPAFSTEAMRSMALSRFTSALATFVSAGINSDTAMKESLAMTEHRELSELGQKTYEDMINPQNPKGLAQAIYDNKMIDPMFARTLLVGGRSGNTETVLQNLSHVFFEDATAKIDSLIDVFEPTLAAFLTIAVGATLISVMLPLIGIMGAIG